MNDKEFALETIRRLPDHVSMEDISQRLEFLAAIRKGLDQIERGEVAHWLTFLEWAAPSPKPRIRLSASWYSGLTALFIG